MLEPVAFNGTEAPLLLVPFRLCPDCGESKPRTAEYWKFKGGAPTYACCRKCHYNRHKATTLPKKKLWYMANSDEVRRRVRARYEAQKPEILEKQREYRRRRGNAISRVWLRATRSDLSFRLNRAMSERMRECLRGRKASQKWELIVGYTIADLREHLERQFRRGMTWNNYGVRWHIDHIRPVSSFSLASADEVRECWSLANLRPLLAAADLRKHSKREFLV